MPRPYVVKPMNEGSSVGVRIVRNGANLGALDDGWSFGEQVMVERFIPGREFTVAVMGDRPLAVTEITTDRGFYDYDAKYAPGGSRHVVPAQVDPGVYAGVAAPGAARAPFARLPRRLPCRSALGRRAAVHAGGQHPAGDDSDLAGTGAGGIARDLVSPSWWHGWSSTRSATDDGLALFSALAAIKASRGRASSRCGARAGRSPFGRRYSWRRWPVAPGSPGAPGFPSAPQPTASTRWSAHQRGWVSSSARSLSLAAGRRRRQPCSMRWR